MQVYINEEKKLFEIWMTNADQRDEACEEQIKALAKRNRGKGWLTVVYKSGSEDLVENTSALLVSNRDRAVRHEVEQERLAKAAPRPSVLAKLNRRQEDSGKSSKVIQREVEI